ncbi:hypothetical protein [Methanoregula sp. PtaU1.Bin006]|uniref:hypothetical protein n=1 Tax=Methanoregula sp. PtaU1.Bin006 TaxID=1811681 RepID=UPI0025F0288B|nr:hypothetical protein [Methanoregula sp. PtaU1.Bin006]
MQGIRQSIKDSHARTDEFFRPKNRDTSAVLQEVSVDILFHRNFMHRNSLTCQVLFSEPIDVTGICQVNHHPVSLLIPRRQHLQGLVCPLNFLLEEFYELILIQGTGHPVRFKYPYHIRQDIVTDSFNQLVVGILHAMIPTRFAAPDYQGFLIINVIQ